MINSLLFAIQPFVYVLIGIVVVAIIIVAILLVLKSKKAKQEDGVVEPTKVEESKEEEFVPAEEETEEEDDDEDEEEELTLKESIEKASHSETKTEIHKQFIRDYLRKRFNDEVIVNERENYTSTGLPLADTHYVNKGHVKKCFVYVYETEGTTLLLINADHHLSHELHQEGKLVNKSLFPKSKDQWYSLPIDSKYTNEDIEYILDYCYFLPLGVRVERDSAKKAKGEVTLKESLAIAKESSVNDIFNKKFVVDHLEEKYGEEVIVNERANFTSTGLPLADTHYVNKGDVKKCFIYVYEVDGTLLLLGNADNKLMKELKDEGKVVNKSLFPKSKDTWLSIPIDSKYTSRDVRYIVDYCYGLQLGEKTEKEVEHTHQAHHLKDVEVQEKVTVAEAEDLIGDEVVKEAIHEEFVKSLGGKKTIINIDIISENFNSGDKVTIKELKEKGLIQSKFDSVKVLARGVLDKKLTIVADDFSDDAIKMIVATGGEVIELKQKK